MYLWNSRKVATGTDGFLFAACEGGSRWAGSLISRNGESPVHRLLDFGFPVRGLVLQRGPTRPGGRALRPLLGVHRIAALHPAYEAKATGAPAGRTADGRSLAILLSIWRAQRAFLPLPAVLLLLLEPRKQSRRRTERPELEDDLAMFLVLGDEEYPLALRNDIDGLLKRNLVVAFPFLAAR